MRRGDDRRSHGKGKDQSVPGGSSAARGAAAMDLLEQQHRGALRDQGEVQVQVTVSVTTGQGSGDSKDTKNYVVEEASRPYKASQPAGAELPGVQQGFEGIDRWKNFLHQETEQPSQKPEPTAEESTGPFHELEGPWQRRIYQNPMTGKSDFWDY